MHNLAIDFNMNLPVFIMVFYTATAVCSTIAMGIMGYTFRKNRTKGYTLMILSIQIMMSSYSGS
ncbi:MAG: hypothetical protein V2I33_21080 [Kangiellaceae bacterium]|nr:hypothetical protein [Kangiellaceae bacterium]